MAPLDRYHRAVARNIWSLLLLLLVGNLLLKPVLGESDAANVAALILPSLIFAGTIWASGVSPGHRRAGYLLIVIWCGTRTADFLGASVQIALAIETTVVVGGSLWLTFRYLLRTRPGTAEGLAGAIFGYLLLVLSWALLYRQIEIWRPGAFDIPSAEGTDTPLIYFSLVTITTLGYGDIRPVDPIARVLAGFEAITGTLYVAVMIGSIVGAFSGQQKAAAPPARKADDDN